MQAIAKETQPLESVPTRRQQMSVASIEKQSNGDLTCTLHSGKVFTVPAAYTEIQTFIVWTMLQRKKA